MANTLNIDFYESLIDSMTKAAGDFNNRLDKERTQKEEALAAVQELTNKLAESNAANAILQSQLAQAQSVLDADQLKKLAQLAQKLDGLYDVIAFATATPKQVEAPVTEEAPKQVEAPEEIESATGEETVEAVTDEEAIENATEETEKPKRSKSSR